MWGVISVTLFKHALPIFPSSACITHNWPTLTQTSRGDYIWASGKCLDSPRTDSPGARKQPGTGAGPGPRLRVSQARFPSPSLDRHTLAGPIRNAFHQAVGSEAATGRGATGVGQGDEFQRVSLCPTGPRNRLVTDLCGSI